MASVHLAYDSELGRAVALKVPVAQLADDETFRARFLREARLAARLVHPNVVRVYDAGQDERGLYIVMEYVEGETLADEVARRRCLTSEEVAAIGVDISAGLGAAHAAGLVHRDVKPHNIMRAADGTTKLGDFGIARATDSTVVTEHGTVLGTAAYLAPEQARGERVTAAADLYSLGVVLYEALTGRLPHDGESLPELLLRREQEAPTPVRAIAPDAPRELEEAITQCLARQPEDRPASAAALGVQLAALAGPPTRRLTASGGEPETRVLTRTGARTALTSLLPARSLRGRVLALPAFLFAALALAFGIWAVGGDTLAVPTVASASQSSHPPAAPLTQPPPTIAQTQPSQPAPCAEHKGKDKGTGKGRGKAKGHEKQREKLARQIERCEEASD
jgi:eukaryotic-like serine/threonine-protein kinase